METLPRNGIFEKPTLLYPIDALEPILSKETLLYHYGKHLQAYLNNLNAALSEHNLQRTSLEEIVKKSSGSLFNNASQVLNHELYFAQFQKPKENNLPHGMLLRAFEKQFGSFETFQKLFEKKALALFGSGWIWLSTDKSGHLQISEEQNAGNPITKNLKPILTFDVWEHAYYIDYRNRRAEHINALWQILNWEILEQRYTEYLPYHL